MKADSLSVPRHRGEESLSIYPYTYSRDRSIVFTEGSQAEKTFDLPLPPF